MVQFKKELIDRYDSKSKTWFDENNIPIDRNYAVKDKDGNLRYIIKEVNEGHELDSWHAGYKVFGAYAVFKQYESGLFQISPWYVMYGTAERNMKKLASAGRFNYTLVKKNRMREIIETKCEV